MTVAGVEGMDPMRASATAAATNSLSGVGAPAPTPAPPRVPGRDTQRPTGGFENPELTSGLLSDNITPVQRDGLGRLGRLLRMPPRELLDSLRGGTGLGALLAARRLGSQALFGMFDKGLLIDAQA
ncbi:hypothetical protein [Mobilicoccus pelagius]|uniref:Uncharacterized protein n=1 Tax=Mobilicoccus pelagius NBRC 104925 TaxID=1089455 RepID=H5UR41_9MICO|nr:hypothetical protein [Mobilicoccus pelagius]GAB48199.1 hypothetical protein MOPEL_067_00480 [Mobilicoccus pelagius NBRC 104925]